MRLLIAFFALWLALAKANDFKVVCYFGSWAVYRTGNGNIAISDIDPTLCTHLIYTFVGLTSTGEVRVLDPWSDLPDNGGKDGFKKFNALRERSPGTKTLVAIGGWNEGSATYSAVVADASLRSTFVKSILSFTLDYGFDGFDLDWEYPNQRGGSAADLTNYVLLIKELRTLFDEHGLLLSAAVAAAEISASLSYDIPRISEYLDFVNIMTYDFHVSGEATTGHNAPLYAAAREMTQAQRSLNVNATVYYWLSQGASAKKLVLGTGFYGRSFTLTDSAQNVPGSPASGAGTAGPYTRENGMLGYNEICEYQASGWTSAWDEEQRVPYAYQGKQWVSYDNVRSITEKAELVKTLGLGGAMIWSIETDDFRGTCGEKYPLLKALNTVLREGGSDFSSTSSSSATTKAAAVEQSTSGSITTTTTTTTTVKPETNDPEESNIICSSSALVEYVRNSENCSKFWICQKVGDDYKITSFSCQAGLYFDTKYNVCNYDYLVDC